MAAKVDLNTPADRSAIADSCSIMRTEQQAGSLRTSSAVSICRYSPENSSSFLPRNVLTLRRGYDYDRRHLAVFTVLLPVWSVCERSGSVSKHASPNSGSHHSSNAAAEQQHASGSGQPHHAAAHVVIELGEHAHHAAESTHKFLERGNNGFKILSGVKAYKEYSWIKDAPVKSISTLSGKRRAIIVSRGWKFVHDVTILNAEKLEKFGDYLAVAGVALEIAKSHEKIKLIHASKDSTSLKAQRYIALGSTAVFKAVSSPIVPVTHLLTQGIVKAATLAHAPHGEIATNARAIDMAVKSSYDQIMESDNVVNYINSHLVIK